MTGLGCRGKQMVNVNLHHFKKKPLANTVLGAMNMK